MTPTKPYWEMNTAELAEATKEFDQEFIADSFKPLSPAMRARWERLQGKKPAKAKPAAGLSVTVRSDLLAWLTAQAKKKKLSRSRFVSELLETAKARAKA